MLVIEGTTRQLNLWVPAVKKHTIHVQGYLLECLFPRVECEKQPKQILIEEWMFLWTVFIQFSLSSELVVGAYNTM